MHAAVTQITQLCKFLMGIQGAQQQPAMLGCLFFTLSDTARQPQADILRPGKQQPLCMTGQGMKPGCCRDVKGGGFSIWPLVSSSPGRLQAPRSTWYIGCPLAHLLCSKPDRNMGDETLVKINSEYKRLNKNVGGNIWESIL